MNKRGEHGSGLDHGNLDLNTEIGIASLEKLVDGIRAEGYEFISLQELRRRGG